MDSLSSVLDAVRLTGVVFFEVQASDPWVAETPPGASIVGSIFPGSQNLIPYHAVTSGSCWAWALDEPPVHLSAGDIVVFPHGDAHVVSSAPGMRGIPDMKLYRTPRDRQLPFHVRMGAETGAVSAKIVCGFLGCDARPFNPLLTALPRIIRVSATNGGPLAAFFELARNEAKEEGIGGETMLGRLSELMFVQVVRRYLETVPEERASWLSALRDPFVGVALAALHGDPSRDWTLNSLAEEAGLSRSRLAERFTHLVGRSPMQYLLHWRMQLASNRLRESTDTIAAVAHGAGYESEVAFSRAFKKVVGMPPSEWRSRP